MSGTSSKLMIMYEYQKNLFFVLNLLLEGRWVRQGGKYVKSIKKHYLDVILEHLFTNLCANLLGTQNKRKTWLCFL